MQSNKICYWLLLFFFSFFLCVCEMHRIIFFLGKCTVESGCVGMRDTLEMLLYFLGKPVDLSGNLMTASCTGRAGKLQLLLGPLVLLREAWECENGR